MNIRTLPIALVAILCPANAFAQDIEPALDLSARVSIVDAPILDDELIADGDALSLRIAPSLVWAGEGYRVRASSSNRFIHYLDDARADRWRHLHRLEAATTASGDTDVLAYAERGTGLATAEFSDTDQWEAGARLEHRIGTDHRLRLGGGWRWRTYDDLERSSGEGPEVRAEYRYRFAANHYLGAEIVRESIDSDTERRRFDRTIASLSYTRPVARDLRARPQLSYRAIDYPGRPVAPLADGVREDRVWLPELTLLYSPGDFTITGEAQYIARSSTDPAYDENGYRLGVEVGIEL